MNPLSAVQGINMLQRISGIEVVPNLTTQSEFDALMQVGTSVAKPELTLCEQAHQFAQSYQSNMQVTENLNEVLSDPAKSLVLQMKVAAAAITVDVTAKLAGSAAQAINRLVSIQ